MELKDNIKAKRLEHKMTLEDLSRRVGVSRQTIQRYESGVISNIPSDKIEKIANALGTSPGYLMGWEDNLNEHTADLTVDLLTDSNMLIHVDRLISLEKEDQKTIYDMIDFMFNKKKEGL